MKHGKTCLKVLTTWSSIRSTNPKCTRKMVEVVSSLEFVNVEKIGSLIRNILEQKLVQKQLLLKNKAGFQPVSRTCGTGGGIFYREKISL